MTDELMVALTASVTVGLWSLAGCPSSGSFEPVKAAYEAEIMACSEPPVTEQQALDCERRVDEKYDPCFAHYVKTGDTDRCPK